MSIEGTDRDRHVELMSNRTPNLVVSVITLGGLLISELVERGPACALPGAT